MTIIKFVTKIPRKVSRIEHITVSNLKSLVKSSRERGDVIESNIPYPITCKLIGGFIDMPLNPSPETSQRTSFLDDPEEEILVYCKTKRMHHSNLTQPQGVEFFIIWR